ncbi:hypothetical protein Bbelb_189670 [Branchiostoma belcheri]|nr:hypothetical protein Bbelb_189670 [Branchiostoma belcheri]
MSEAGSSYKDGAGIKSFFDDDHNRTVSSMGIDDFRYEPRDSRKRKRGILCPCLTAIFVLALLGGLACVGYFVVFKMAVEPALEKHVGINGTWSEWGLWSVCSATCGRGVQKRTRECENPHAHVNDQPLCFGESVENKPCSAALDCPDCARQCDVGTLNENCTACTCKGHVMLGWVYDEVTRDPVQFVKYQGQSQQTHGHLKPLACHTSRTFLRTPADQCLIKFGRANHQPNMAQPPVHIPYECFEEQNDSQPCSLPTPSHGWGEVYLGDSVQILGLSNRTGQFVIHGVCANGENTVRLERDEYMPKYVRPFRMNETATQLVARIDPYEEPYFLEPQHKLRYEGQSVVMCCRAVGTPEPEYFEWYKDDVLLDSEKWGYNNTNELEIYNITREDAGDYSCTTRTPAGESTSNITTLTIYPNGTEFCNTVPNVSYVQLSVPCRDPEQSNAFVSEVNIGVCANGTISPCIVWSAYNYTNPGTCQDQLEYCCGPVAFGTKRLLCPFVPGTLTPIDYPITTACGCKKCDDTFIPTVPASTTFRPINNVG